MKQRAPFTLLAIVAASVLSAACAGTADVAGPGVSVVGAWTLQTVGGAPLPYVMDQSGSDKSELTADVITFIGSGQFTQISQVRVTSAGQVTTQPVLQAGTFTSNKGAVSVLFAGIAEPAAGSISGATFALAINGLPFVYTRQ